MSYKPANTPGLRSHSQLSSYLHCGWQYHLTRNMGVPEGASVWLPGGSAFHLTTETFDREAFESGPDMAAEGCDWRTEFNADFDQCLEEFDETQPDRSTWRTAGRPTKDKPNGEDIEWWRQAGAQMVEDYIAWRVENKDKWRIASYVPEGGTIPVPAIEAVLSQAFGSVRVRGAADLVLEDANGTLVVVDKKTGSRVPDSPLQLGLYSVQLEKVMGRQVAYGAFYMARKAELTPPQVLTTHTEGTFKTIYETLDKGIRDGVFLPNISSMCKSCGVRDACVFVGGVEPPERVAA